MKVFNLDRRIVYFLVLLGLGLPIALGYSLKPSPMKTGDKLYELIEKIEKGPGRVALVGLDYGPNTRAENEVQAEVLLEHLFRRRIPVGVFTLYAQAATIVDKLPAEIAKRLEKENPGERWEYGKDWVNFGYRAGMTLFVQSIPKAQDQLEFWGKDANGTRLSDLPAMKDFHNFNQIVLVGEVTGLSGLFSMYVQFFQSSDYVPPLVHGCTSITIPEAYNYLDSGQLKGLLEGLAGAAWYSQLLTNANPKREEDRSPVRNTATGVGHILIIALVALGNLSMLVAWLRRRYA